jgi:chromosome segregation ATPase
MQGDILGNTFPWPLGNGTCVDIFKAKCENLKKERPEYFEDEAPERILLENTDFLKEILLDIRSSVEKHANEQTALNKINVSQLDAIKQKVDDQQRRLDQIDHRITDLQKNISERIKGPTDFSSGFLYRMPIVGGILRAIFK